MGALVTVVHAPRGIEVLDRGIEFIDRASVQLVGVYVVFASLILPALAARGANGYVLSRALVSGLAAVVAAILISAVADLPAGPFLVVCFGISAVAARLLSRRKRPSGGDGSAEQGKLADGKQSA